MQMPPIQMQAPAIPAAAAGKKEGPNILLIAIVLLIGILLGAVVILLMMPKKDPAPKKGELMPSAIGLMACGRTEGAGLVLRG